MESLKKKKLIYYSFIILLLISIVSVSALDLGTFKSNTSINILQICDNCTAINLTNVIYPNSTFALLGQFNMTQNGSTFYYSNFTQTNIIGDYSYTTCDNQNGVQSCKINYFKITATGDQLTIAQAILNFLFLIASLFIVSFFLYFAITIPFKNPRDFSGFYVGINGGKWMKIVCIVMSYITLMWFFALLYSTSNNYLAIESMSQFFYYFYYVMLSIMWPLLVVSAIVSFIIWLKDMKIAKGIEQHLRIK